MRVRLGRGALSLDHDVRVRECDRATMGRSWIELAKARASARGRCLVASSATSRLCANKFAIGALQALQSRGGPLRGDYWIAELAYRRWSPIPRSRDGGRQWAKLAGELPRKCSIGAPFVTSVIVDPDDHRMVRAGVEIDGVFRSLDGGDTWRRLNHDPLDLIEVDLAVPACPVGCYGRSPASNC
jgi:hypothetical protein